MRAVHAILRGLAIAAIPGLPVLLLHRADMAFIPAPAIRIVNRIGHEPPGGSVFVSGAEAGMADMIPQAASAPPQAIGIAGRLPGDAQAMVRLGDGTVVTLAIGGSANGWRLVAIEPDRLHMRRGAEERTLVLPVREADPPQ